LFVHPSSQLEDKENESLIDEDVGVFLCQGGFIVEKIIIVNWNNLEMKRKRLIVFEFNFLI
jgi:hypothetical protein